MPFCKIKTQFFLNNGGTLHFHARFKKMIDDDFGSELESHYQFCLAKTKVIYLSEFGYLKIQTQYDCIKYPFLEKYDYAIHYDLSSYSEKRIFEIYQYLYDHIPNSISIKKTIHSTKTGMKLIGWEDSGITVVKSELYYSIIDMFSMIFLVVKEVSADDSIIQKMNEFSFGSEHKPYIPSEKPIAAAIMNTIVHESGDDLSFINSVIVYYTSNSGNIDLARGIANLFPNILDGCLIANSIVDTINRESGSKSPSLILRLIKIIKSGRYALQINYSTLCNYQIDLPEKVILAGEYLGITLID